MPRIRTRVALALISAAVIALELMLMRVLSLRFWHHFSYLIISTALVGFGASGTALALGRRLVAGRGGAVLWVLALAFALAIPLAVRAAERVDLNVQFLTWDFREAGRLVLVELVFLAPLLLAGAAVGVALMDEPGRIGGHYAANLVGSGAGAAIPVALLGTLTTPQVMIVLSALACAAAAVMAPWRRRAGIAATLAIGAAIALVHFLWPWTPGMSQYKRLPGEMLKPGTEILFTREGPLGRIDVVSGQVHEDPPGMSFPTPDIPEADLRVPPHVLMILDGDQTGAVFAANAPADYVFMDYTTSALPYHLLERPAVLIFGAGGGAEVGLARYHDARRVVVVEANPQVIALLTGPLRALGGAVYEAPDVELVNRDPRGYLAAGGERFDLIWLSLLGPAARAAGAQAGQESALCTVEAFEGMLKRLAPGGMVCVTCPAQVPPRDGLRVFATAAEAIGRLGEPAEKHLAMIRSRAETVTVLISRPPLGASQLKAVRRFCDVRGFDLCFLPDLRPEEVNRFHELTERPAPRAGAPATEPRPRAFYYEGARAILGADKERYFDRSVFDVRPVTDDRPYFFHFFRLRALPAMIEQLGNFSRSYLELGYVLLLATLGQAVPVAAALIVLPLAFRRSAVRASTGKARALGYFLLIGLGFMFLEMGFMHRLTLYLADPLYSAALAMGAFLVFAGAGSLLSGYWRVPAGRLVRRAALLVVGLTILYVFGLPPVLERTQAWPAAARALVVVGAIAPLAAAMGHMFPTAIRRLGQATPALVPWCWAINGFASVVATVGASLLAMEIGFRMVACLAAAAYLAAGALAPRPSAGSA